MIQHFYLEQLPGANKIASDSDVCLGWCGIPAWMIVRQHHRRGISDHGLAKHITRVHYSRIQCAVGEMNLANQTPSSIEKDGKNAPLHKDDIPP